MSISTSTSAPLSSTQNPLAEYHAKLSQHLNALLTSSSPRLSSSVGSSPTIRGGRTDRTAGPPGRRNGSIDVASHLNAHGSIGESSTLRQRAHSPGSSLSGSSHSAHSGSRPLRKSSRQAQPPTPSREIDGTPNLDLTARPDKHAPVLHYDTHEDEEENAPPLVHHQNNTSSSQSGPTDAIASPPEMNTSSVASPAERFLSREAPRRGPRTPAHDHVHLGDVESSPEQVESREEEHKRAWKADGARVWKSIPEGFTLNLDRGKRSRRSSDESKDAPGEKEKMLAGLQADTTPKPHQKPRSTSPLGPSSPLSPGQKSVPSVHSNGSGSEKKNRKPGILHRDSFRITNDPDLATKMGLVVSTPAPPADMTPRTFTYGKFNQHIEPVPQGKPDVLADINGRLRLSSEPLPRGHRSPLNPSVQAAQKSPIVQPAGEVGKPAARAGASGPTIMGPSFSIPRPKGTVIETPEGKARAATHPQTNAKSSKQQKVEELRDAFAEDDVDEEYEARREIRLKRRQVDLRRRIGMWASAVSVVDSTVPDIEPTPPSPSVATAAMRASPLVASPLVPAFSSPHSEKSKLSLSIIPETQSSSSRSTSSSRRKSKPKSNEPSRHNSGDKPLPEAQGAAPKPTLKSSMFSYSTSIGDSSRRMRAIDALLGDMSLKGSNLNPSRTSADQLGSTTYSAVLDRVGGLDTDSTPRHKTKSKEAPSSLNPRDHSHVPSKTDRGDRAREIERLTEFSTAIDLTTGAGFAMGKTTRVEIREGMPTPKSKGLGVTSYTEIV